MGFYLPRLAFCANILLLRGLSSVGRALAWHARGRGFESHRLHLLYIIILKYMPFLADLPMA